MNLSIVGKSDRAVFAGIDEKGEYVVFSLDDIKDIEIGDILSTERWGTPGRFFKTVKNLTKRHEVRICIEDWDCSRERAAELLSSLNSPTNVTL